MKIYFVGIGGIGVSALAKYYLENGHQIFGSDLLPSEITNNLEKKGAKIFIGKHKGKNVPKDTDLLIFSPAISKDNPELEKAQKMGIQCLSYPQALGELTKRHFTIAICGTHGKSTVTAMVGLILTEARFDPTVILGTKLKEFGDSNCRVGKSKYLIIEADEYKESFLNYWPKIIVLTTIEPDHLDYYKNFKNYILAFRKFISHLPENGILIANQDEFLKNLIGPGFFAIAKNVVYYSFRDREVAKLKKILKIPGDHNVSNALAALKVARILKIPDEISFKVLSGYRGSWRRFEVLEFKLTKRKKITVISDYAHHPTEIRVTLKAAREKYPKKEIWCIFQPHQYQRTYYLFNDFVKVLKEVLIQKFIDKLIITDIYEVTGREDKRIKKKIDSKKLVQVIIQQIPKNESIVPGFFKIKYIPGLKKVEKFLKKNLEGEKVLIIMGAGDIYNLTKIFKR